MNKPPLQLALAEACAVPASTYERRQAAYAELVRVTDAAGMPGCVITGDGDEWHIQIHVPGTDDLQQVHDAGQRALWVLAKYLEQIELQLAGGVAESKQPRD